MTIRYKDILLWGHSLKAYKKMFSLTDDELKLSILDCCGGPASFNAELTDQGGHVISTDPLFSLNETQIAERIEEVFAQMLAIVREHKDRFLWEDERSVDKLAQIRHSNIELFLKDFAKGLEEGRYFPDSPPDLHFQHYQFDLALCSHYLFANSPEQTVEYHAAAIENLCDVAKEVRVFPLLDSMGEIPDIVGPVTKALHDKDLGVEIKAVPYQFQKKGNAMLRVWAQKCEV